MKKFLVLVFFIFNIFFIYSTVGEDILHIEKIAGYDENNIYIYIINNDNYEKGGTYQKQVLRIIDKKKLTVKKEIKIKEIIFKEENKYIPKVAYYDKENDIDRSKLIFVFSDKWYFEQFHTEIKKESIDFTFQDKKAVCKINLADIFEIVKDEKIYFEDLICIGDFYFITISFGSRGMSRNYFEKIVIVNKHEIEREIHKILR